MDPFELLLLASKLNDNNINYSGTNDNQISLPFDYRNHIHETLLGLIKYNIIYYLVYEILTII